MPRRGAPDLEDVLVPPVPRRREDADPLAANLHPVDQLAHGEDRGGIVPVVHDHLEGMAVVDVHPPGA